MPQTVLVWAKKKNEVLQCRTSHGRTGSPHYEDTHVSEYVPYAVILVEKFVWRRKSSFHHCWWTGWSVPVIWSGRCDGEGVQDLHKTVYTRMGIIFSNDDTQSHVDSCVGRPTCKSARDEMESVQQKKTAEGSEPWRCRKYTRRRATRRMMWCDADEK